jgi:hypothetical protein
MEPSGRNRRQPVANAPPRKRLKHENRQPSANGRNGPRATLLCCQGGCGEFAEVSVEVAGAKGATDADRLGRGQLFTVDAVVPAGPVPDISDERETSSSGRAMKTSTVFVNNEPSGWIGDGKQAYPLAA